MGGDFEPFAVQDRENPNVFAASPDGKYIVMGESLLNGDGQRIGPLPLTNVASTQAWTPAGLVYIDQVGKFWLWNVESPQALPLPRFDNVNTDGWTISEKGDCSYVGRLQATGAVKSVFQHCGDQVVSLSPGWAAGPRLALTASGKVYDTASGSLVQRLDLPTGLTELSDSVHLQYGGWWRGSSSNDVPPLVFLSFTIDLTRIYDDVDLDHRYASVIIGCQVTTGDCGQQFRSEVDNPEVPVVWR
jgi:hypothetical protein